MELSLYAIDATQQALNAMLEESGGELTPELEEALAINEDNFLAKSRNYGYAILRYEAMSAAISEEKRRLDALKKTCDKAAARMEDRLVKAMRTFDKPVVELDTLRLSLRKSERVVIDDETRLPADCIVVKTEVSKTDVKRHLKAGESIGAHLDENFSLQIK